VNLGGNLILYTLILKFLGKKMSLCYWLKRLYCFVWSSHKVVKSGCWSLTAYDASTAAGLDNGQEYPSIGDRDNLIQNADGSITPCFAPKASASKEKNWVKTVPGKGWFSLIRLYGPDKVFFDRQWKPGYFERID